jgi:S-DNA-T family DNA segregation ATPase FtsK/SpoIIIE
MLVNQQLEPRFRPKPEDLILCDSWERLWSDACEYVGLAQAVHVAAGVTMKTPKLGYVSVDPPYLMVQLVPGQVPEDIRAQAPRLARALGMAGLRVKVRSSQWVRVDLLTQDPLAAVYPMPPYAGQPSSVLIGIDEAGGAITTRPRLFPHVAVQGVTRSGKSVWTYGLLSQLARFADVLIAGCDPSGLLFRPFVGTKHEEVQVSGVSDPEAFGKLLDALTLEMDDRIRHLEEDRDQVVISPTVPLIFVIFEEIAGLFRVCDQHDRNLGKLVRSLLARLLAEGAKAGFRVMLIVQRAEAAVVGAFERAQCAMRVTFGVDSMESVKLLHPAAELGQCAEHLTAPPGIALFSAPGVSLVRFRAPFIGGYAEYCAAVREATAMDA